MLATPSIPFLTHERQAILFDLARLQDELVALRPALDQDEDNADLLSAEDDLVEDLLAMRAQYMDGVPVVDISRCPFTGLRFSYPIDTFGLDGPWWDYHDPVRPEFSRLPSVYAVTGAVSLNEPLEPAPFVVSPGPGRPYVIPRLLEPDGAVAVLSSLPVGRHTAYAVIYYSYPAQPDRPVVNEWGSSRWYFDRRVDDPGWEDCPLLSSELDFDLRPWITGERLYWIGPDDQGLIPYKGLDGCPYIDLDGATDLQLLYEGSLQ